MPGTLSKPRAAGRAGEGTPVTGQAALMVSTGNRILDLQRQLAGTTLVAFSRIPFAATGPAMMVMAWSSLWEDTLRRANDVARNCLETVLDAQLELARNAAALEVDPVAPKPIAKSAGMQPGSEQRRQFVVIDFPDRRTRTNLPSRR